VNNHLTRINFADGSGCEFEYTTDGLMTLKIEPQGNRFEHVFDDQGRLTEITDEEGGRWRYTRTVDDSGNVRVEMTTAENNVTSYIDNTVSTGAYTSDVTDSSGGQTAFSKSSDGLTVNQSLACGMDLEFIYDVDPEYKFKVLSDMTESTPSGLNKVTQLNKTYEDTDADDVPDLITDALTVNNKTTTLAHDTLQAQKVVTSPEGRTVTTHYNPDTLFTERVSIPGLFDTSYGYDAQGRRTSVSIDTRQTTFGYNAQGFLETVTDPGSQTTTYSYDPVGRITGASRPDGGYLRFAHDKNGNMTLLTNPVDVAHGFGFNNVNLNSSYQTPLSGSYSNVYDRDRRLIQKNFPSGKTIIYNYTDPADPNDKSKLRQVRTPEGNIDFTYLCGTKIESISKRTESIAYGYDGKLVTSETMTGTLNQSLAFSHNNDFEVSSFIYADGTTDYSYDNDGLLTEAGSFTIIRNADNGLPESVSGGTLALSRTFNGYGEIESQSLALNSLNVASWSLVRDHNGRITDKTETVDGATSGYGYTYDSMGRLLTVTKDSVPVEEYQYDLNGTRIYEMNSLRGIAGRSYSYSDEDHLLSAGSVTYAYDPDGFLITKTDGSDITTYNYSSRGELLSVDMPIVDAAPESRKVIVYIHDPQGRRIAKMVDDVVVEKYLWQGLTRLLAIYDGADTLLMRFEYADGRMPLAMNAEGVTYFLYYDQVESIRIVADSAGNVVKKINFDAFGNIIEDSNPAFMVPFGFAGGLHDRDTGLVRFGYRDYDPDIGRWTAKDPIFFAGGDTDLYGYVLNDPINLVDQDGLLWEGITRVVTMVKQLDHI
jgi:RHS repeat-associated protein